MKKFMSLLAACAMMVTLTGCAKKADKPQAKKEHAAKPAKKSAKKAKPAKKDAKKKSPAKKEVKKGY